MQEQHLIVDVARLSTSFQVLNSKLEIKECEESTKGNCNTIMSLIEAAMYVMIHAQYHAKSLSHDNHSMLQISRTDILRHKYRAFKIKTVPCVTKALMITHVVLFCIVNSYFV